MHRPTVFADAQNATVSFVTPSLKKRSPRRRPLLRRHQLRKLLQLQMALLPTAIPRSPRRKLQLRRLQPRKLLQRRPQQNQQMLRLLLLS